MERKGYQYWGERIVNLAMGDPTVNPLDEAELVEYARERADDLCLDPDPIEAVARSHVATTADFESATAISTDNAVEEVVGGDIS